MVAFAELSRSHALHTTKNTCSAADTFMTICSTAGGMQHIPSARSHADVQGWRRLPPLDTAAAMDQPCFQAQGAKPSFRAHSSVNRSAGRLGRYLADKLRSHVDPFSCCNTDNDRQGLVAHRASCIIFDWGMSEKFCNRLLAIRTSRDCP